MKIEEFFEVIWLIFLAILIPSIEGLLAIELGRAIGGIYGFMFFIIVIIATVAPWIIIYKKIEGLLK